MTLVFFDFSYNLMEKVSKRSLGERLRHLRNKQNLTASEVAQAIRVSVSTYREWENGRSIRGEPYVELAKILQVSIPELLTGEHRELSKIFSEFDELEKKLKKFKETLYSSF